MTPTTMPEVDANLGIIPRKPINTLEAEDSTDERRSPDAMDISGNDRISTLAYQYWQERGCPDGCPDEDWYRAEQELMRR